MVVTTEAGPNSIELDVFLQLVMCDCPAVVDLVSCGDAYGFEESVPLWVSMTSCAEMELVRRGLLIEGDFPPWLESAAINKLAASVKSIKLPHNKISGHPPSLNLFKSLEVLCLQGNRFNPNSFIPRNWGALHGLREIRLNDCGLSGSIPASLASLPQLSILCLQNNSLSGSIPSNLGEAVELRMLNFANNRLVGKLPEIEPHCWTVMAYLDVSHNTLSGPVPMSWRQLPASMELLALECNSLCREAWYSTSGAHDDYSILPNIPTNLRHIHVECMHLRDAFVKRPDQVAVDQLQQMGFSDEAIVAALPPAVTASEAHLGDAIALLTAGGGAVKKAGPAPRLSRQRPPPPRAAAAASNTRGPAPAVRAPATAVRAPAPAVRVPPPALARAPVAPPARQPVGPFTSPVDDDELLAAELARGIGDLLSVAFNGKKGNGKR